MSKRIIRIAGQSLRPTLSSLSGIMINVVLKDGNTFFGKLSSIEESGFTITDQRTHKHHFFDKDLYEILYDKLEKS